MLCAAAVCLLQACAAPRPGDPADTLATIFDPNGAIRATDGRATFRSIFCAINETHGPELPDYRACGEALRAIDEGQELVVPTYSVDHTVRPMTIFIVPGLGHECFNDLLDGGGVLREYAAASGHTVHRVPVKGFANSEQNADIIRETVMQKTPFPDARPVIMLAYSKGANDVLAALALYPEVAERVDAVVSISGAIGGSPLALHARDWSLGLLVALPGVNCEVPEETALTSLRPAVRRAWLDEHALPTSVDYFSVVAYPEAERISTPLRPPYRALARYDSRNDGQLIVFDQVIPGSELLAFVNADHWAIALPIERRHPALEFAGIMRNDFPLEVLFDAILAYIDVR